MATPTTMVVFGHSAGANMAALVAFGQRSPVGGLPRGTTPVGPIDALVTYEGDWVAMARDVPWDSQITADPSLDGYTPWTFLPEHPDLRVVMLVSEHPGVVLRARGG